MNRNFFRWVAVLSWLAAVAAVWVGGVKPAAAVELADFGYGTMRAANSLGGTRPLLVVLVHFNDSPMVGNSNSFEHLVFDTAHQPRNVQGAFHEMSNGRFAWTRAGVVTITVPASDRITNTAARIPDENLAVLLYHSNLVHRTMVSGQVDFAQYADSHGSLTEKNLAIVFLCNGEGGAVRGSGPVRPPGSTCEFNGAVATAGQGNYLQFISHELLHLLGCLDLYPPSCWNAKLSMMSCEDFNTNYAIWHLDPWHKMQLGWSEPRLQSLSAGGIATVPAAQAMDPTAPLLLYDPAAGPLEFWLAEYRTTNSPAGPGYDTNTSGSGMALWHVRHQPNLMPWLLVEYLFPNAQRDWRRCSKCAGLVFAPIPTGYSWCPADGRIHKHETPRSYCLPVDDASAPGQPGWRFCKWCSGLFFCENPNSRDGHCPYAGPLGHDGGFSGNYTLAHDDPRAFGLPGWKFCSKCKVLFSGDPSSCSVGGSHDGSTSGNYTLPLREGWAMHTEAAPDLFRAESGLWGGGAVTPRLKWLNGATTTSRLEVHPFTPGAGSITVEWLTAADTWVDFNWTGLLELGTFDFPYNTFAEGLTGVSRGGTLRVKAGHSPEAARVAKRMRIESHGGTAKVGR